MSSSRRNSYSEDGILAALERGSATSPARRNWALAGGTVAALLVAAVAWLAYSNATSVRTLPVSAVKRAPPPPDEAFTPRSAALPPDLADVSEPAQAAAIVDEPSVANAVQQPARPALVMLPANEGGKDRVAPALPHEDLHVLPAPPEVAPAPAVAAASAPSAAAVITEAPPAPAPAAAAVAPSPVARVAAAKPAPAATASAARASYRARPAERTAKARTAERSRAQDKAKAAAKPVRAAVAKPAQRAAPKKVAAKSTPARVDRSQDAVDSDVALLSAIVAHSSRHAAERAKREACPSGKKCTQKPSSGP